MKKTWIFVAILFLGIGILFGIYWNKKDTFQMVEKKWNVYFSNLTTSVLNGEVYVPETPNIKSTSLKAYDVLITKPGDYSTYTFDVVNDGDYDAKLTSLLKVSPICISLALPENKEDEELVCKNLEYRFYYSNTNKEVTVNDVLKAGTKEKVSVKVGYTGNKELSQEEGVQITLYDMNLIYDKSK